MSNIRPELEVQSVQPICPVETSAAQEACVTGLNGQRTKTESGARSQGMIYRSSKYLSRKLRRLYNLQAAYKAAESCQEQQHYRKASATLIYVLLRRSCSLYTVSTVMTLSKAGSPGLGEDLSQKPINAQTFRYIRSRVLERLFGGQSCQSSKRVWLDKGNGEYRGISIPRHLDKIAQQSVRIILEITNTFTQSINSIGFRIGQSRDLGLSIFLRDCARRYGGSYRLLDVDFRKWFDTIPHAILEELITNQGLHGKVERYLKSTLTSKCVDLKGYPGGLSGPGVSIPVKGTPQGGVLSPLWSNLVATRVDEWIESLGILHCRYADNLLICLPRNYNQKAKENFKVGLEAQLPEGCALHPQKEQWKSILTTLGYFINTNGIFLSHHKYPCVKNKAKDVQLSVWSQMKGKVAWYKVLVKNLTSRRLSLSQLYNQGVILFNNWELLHPDWLSPLTYSNEVIENGGGSRPGLSYVHDYTGYVLGLGRTNSYFNYQFKANKKVQFAQYVRLKFKFK